MKRKKLPHMAMMVFCVAITFIPSRASGLVIKGHFPMQEGMYWNFTKQGDTMSSSWAMLGNFTQEKIGTVSILLQDHAGFLAVRMEWDGLYVYGEYGPEGYRIPDRPLLLLPAEIDFDKPVESSARLASFCPGENVKQTGTINRRVTFTLKSIEDITFENREIRNCAVIEKTTRDNETIVIETMWLVPSIGPVKREIKEGKTVTTYTLTSSGGNRESESPGVSLKEYFPLKPGLALTYREPSGSLVTIETRAWEQKAGWSVMPCIEPSGSAYYLAYNDRGLTAPVKFVSIAGIACVYCPPDRPLVLLPHPIRPGALHTSTSYYRVSQWPSISPMLDFYPEARITGIALCTEDVTTLAGTYRGCLKIYMTMVSSAFTMQREKIKVGCLWLARDIGIVKEEAISLDNTYLLESVNFIFDIQMRDLVKISAGSPAAGATAQEEKPSGGNAQPSEKKSADAAVPIEKLTWAGNSKAMADKTVKASPFFIQSTVKEKLFKSIAQKAGPDGAVTEGMVIEAVREVTPGTFKEKMINDLKPLMTK